MSTQRFFCQASLRSMALKSPMWPAECLWLWVPPAPWASLALRHPSVCAPAILAFFYLLKAPCSISLHGLWEWNITLLPESLSSMDMGHNHIRLPTRFLSDQIPQGCKPLTAPWPQTRPWVHCLQEITTFCVYHIAAFSREAELQSHFLSPSLISTGYSQPTLFWANQNAALSNLACMPHVPQIVYQSRFLPCLERVSVYTLRSPEPKWELAFYRLLPWPNLVTSYSPFISVVTSAEKHPWVPWSPFPSPLHCRGFTLFSKLIYWNSVPGLHCKLQTAETWLFSLPAPPQHIVLYLV
jgi:hypothetical protein